MIPKWGKEEEREEKASSRVRDSDWIRNNTILTHIGLIMLQVQTASVATLR